MMRNEPRSEAPLTAGRSHSQWESALADSGEPAREMPPRGGRPGGVDAACDGRVGNRSGWTTQPADLVRDGGGVKAEGRDREGRLAVV